ncbi:MAG TPA: hypothetical protein VMY36_02885 [Patescibacteria group bacterium]|nr:hypothetical protein [Patescibacteria group bacterium]
MLTKLFTKKKITLTLLFFFLFSFILSGPIQAFSTPESTYQFQFESAINSEEMNLQSFVYETIKAIFGSIVHFIFGVVLNQGEQNQNQTGMIRTIGSFIAYIYATPPASGIQYLASIGEKLRVVKPTYAQEDTGFERMADYLPLWKTFRNITYVFFVLILVFMGFAIMFRVKINPQTVITIQSALPKVVIGLILITFSYAIVGLMIDFMWVFTNLIIFTFKHIPDTDPNFPQWLSRLITAQAVTDASHLAAGIFIILLGPAFATFLTFTIITSTPTIITSIILWPISPMIIGLNVTILFLLAIIFLIIYIRILWALLKAYVMVVLHLIFAPFEILVGILPGSNAISSWFRNLIANLVVLPATIAMIFLSGYLAIAPLFRKSNLGSLVVSSIEGNTSSTFLEDLVAAFRNLGSANVISTIIMLFISIGILALTPKVTDIIKAFLAGKPFEYGAAIGEAVGPIRGVAGMAMMGAGPKIAERITWGKEGRGSGEKPKSLETGISSVIEVLSKKVSG